MQVSETRRCLLPLESFGPGVVCAKKNRADAAGRSEAADLHFDNGLTHTAGLVTRLPAKIRIAFNG
jgi:hypothetical protein